MYAPQRGTSRFLAPRATRRRLLGSGLVASGALGAAMTAACGGGGAGQPSAGSAAAGGEVSVLYYTSTEPANARMQKQQAEINRLFPKIKLTMIAEPQNPDQKFVTMAAGGAPPDIPWMGISFWEHAPAGRLLALDDLLGRDRSFNAKDYYPQSLDLFRHKGKQQALPYGLAIHAMAYNKSLFDKRGVRYPTKDWTIEDFVSIATRLTSAPDASPQTWGAWISPIWVALFMHGGQIYDKGFTKALIDQPPAIRGIQYFYDQNLGALKVAPTTGNAGQLLGNGQLGMTSVAAFGIAVLKQFPDAEWDLVTYPWTAEKTRGSWMSAEGYAIASDSKNKDGAWTVLKYLTGRDSMANFYVPELQTTPAVRSVAEKEFANALPGKNLKALVDSIEFGVPIGGHPVMAIANWIVKVINPMWTEVREGRKSATDAAREAAQQLNRLLKETPA